VFRAKIAATPPADSVMSRERRRSPRIEILGRLHGQVARLDLDVHVREMSLGGLSMETAVAFPPGAIHEFRLTLGDGSFVLLRGRVAHSRETTAADGSRLFVTGVQFLDDEPADGSSVTEIVQRIR
jgi:hypothetical protein